MKKQLLIIILVGLGLSTGMEATSTKRLKAPHSRGMREETIKAGQIATFIAPYNVNTSFMVLDEDKQLDKGKNTGGYGPSCSGQFNEQVKKFTKWKCGVTINTPGTYYIRRYKKTKINNDDSFDNVPKNIVYKIIVENQ